MDSRHLTAEDFLVPSIAQDPSAKYQLLQTTPFQNNPTDKAHVQIIITKMTADGWLLAIIPFGVGSFYRNKIWDRSHLR